MNVSRSISRVIPFALAGAGLYLLIKLSRVNILNSLSFVISKIRFDFSAAVPILFLDVLVSNPTAQPVRVDAINGRVLVNDALVATVSQNEARMMAGHTETPYTIPAKISVLSIVTRISEIFSRDTVIKFIGTVRVEGIDFPIELTYKNFV